MATNECLAGWNSPFDNDDIEMELRAALPADRDGLNGGVASSVLGERIGLGASSVQRRLCELEDEDRVVRVWGAAPSGHPRESWLPAEHPDAEISTEAERDPPD